MIRLATSRDVAVAVDFAADKRTEYEKYSPRFWRQALDARERHAHFLEFCVHSENYTSLVEVEGFDVSGFLVATHDGQVSPFAEEQTSTWLIDDFLLANTAIWIREGKLLLDRLSLEARERDVERLVVVTARRDRPKASFLSSQSFVLAASWWICEFEPRGSSRRAPAGFDATLRAAPPVYEPGGPVALASSRLHIEQVEEFSEWAADCGAVVGIVPARESDTALHTALIQSGYDVASNWYSRSETFVPTHLQLPLH